MRHALARAVLWSAVLALGMTACVSPARTSDQYRDKGRAAVQAAAGEVSTGLLAVRQDRERKILRTVADEVVTSSESSLGSIGSSFGSVQPPSPASDDLRDTVSAALSQAEDAMAHARIAVRRSDPEGIVASETELRTSADTLASVEDEL